MSLSLAAYRAVARHMGEATYLADCPRPTGEVVWLHATSRVRFAALAELGARLQQARGGDLVVLLSYTTPVSVSVPTVPSPKTSLTFHVRVESDHLGWVEGFLDHWRPNICLWTGGYLRPNLLLEASKRQIPLFLADASTKGFDRFQDRWLPKVTREMLGCFAAFMAGSEDAMGRVIRLGVAAGDVEQTGPLRPGALAPTCNMEALETLASGLAGRPIWLACEVEHDELPLVLQAHRRAARRAHRLLLIVVAANSAGNISQQIADQGWRVCQWGTGEVPHEATQILICPDAQQLGLWYRLAPLSFLGGSLLPGHGGRDPLPAAALGSAILHGPHVASHFDSYNRLAAAAASRLVQDADALGDAVLQLSAPDQSAKMAHAGWDVVSESAEMIDRLIDLLQDTLDLGVAA